MFSSIARRWRREMPAPTHKRTRRRVRHAAAFRSALVTTALAAAAAGALTETADAATTFDMGERHSCAVRGAAGIFCWGANELGQLGVGGGNHALRYNYPIRTKKSGESKAVTTGATHTCSLTRDDKAHCWGDNSKGQLGTGSEAPWVKSMVDVPGITGAEKIVAGQDNTCVLKADETVACWGRNLAYESGNTGENPVRSPLTIGVTNVSDIDAGDGHACAVRTSGTVRCWGRNTSGQLGNNTLSIGRPPVQPIGVRTAVAVATGANHSCALLQDQTVTCWGSNTAGQVNPYGSPVITAIPTPVTVGGLANVAAIAAGGDHTCALKTNGSITCWGRNLEGEFGDGTTQDHSPVSPRTPSVTKRVTTATEIAAGAFGTCAKRANLQVLCWGGNHGQMGYGASPDKDFTVPRRVHTLPEVVPFNL